MPLVKRRFLTFRSVPVSGFLWNLLGIVTPVCVAIPATPALLRALGNERFGLLSLAWALIGTAGVLDLGLGRAVTRLVAIKLATGADGELPRVLAVSTQLAALLGAFCSLVYAPLAAAGYRLWAAPGQQQFEADSLRAIVLLGLAIPCVVLSTVWRGFLDGFQQYGAQNVVRSTTGVLTFLGPLLVVSFAPSLVGAVGALVVSRLMAAVAFLYLCTRREQRFKYWMEVDRCETVALVGQCGWMTVSNIVSPLMSTADRFLVGLMLGATAAGYYATIHEALNKTLLLPAALSGVLFPLFSAATAADHPSGRATYTRALGFVALSMALLLGLLFCFTDPILAAWISPEFANRTGVVWKTLTLGILLNGVASVPFALLQGAGFSRGIATLHLAELPIYLTLVYILTRTSGMEGTAIAWCVRAGIDAVVLIAAGFLHFRTRVPAATLLRTVPA